MFRGTSQFDKLLEKSTSNLLLEPDWTSILQLCDCVRQGDVQPKYAVNAIKKKIHSPNPHVALYALQVIESCVKNCGASIHQEIATKPFMEEIRELVKVCTNDSVKNKILELIQAWAYAFRNEPNYRAIQDTVTVMKMEGNTFPTLKESDAMFMADRAPDWADGEVCHRCRVQFSMVQRKHHCRNCGQIFCGKCSSKLSTIPKFGIEKEVRVCEACYDKLNKHTHPKVVDGDLPPEYLTSSLAMQPQVIKDGPPNKSEQEIQEEEDLQLALALSKSDAENKEKEKMRVTQNLLSGVGGGTPTQQTYAPSSTSSAPPALDSNLDMDPELAKYLNRSYWEQKQQQEESSKTMATTIPSAPASSSTSTFSNFTAVKVSEKYQNGETDELDGFVAALRSNIEIFVNRMKSNSSRGRSIANDTAVQGLFMNITAMHSQLLKFSQEQEDSRVRYEGLQDKLNQIKDARAALDALREDHRERLRREAEEAERQRQIQMAYKLEIMRKKKQEYLEYQRQIAMQRMQEQEREMQLRQEQQKQQYMRGLPPGVYAPPQSSYMPPPPQGPSDGSPVHNPYPPQQSHYPQSLPQPQSFQPPPDFHSSYSMPGMGPGMPPVTQGMYGQAQMVPPPGSIPSQQPPPPQLMQSGPSQQPQHIIPNSGPPSLPPNTSNSYHQTITSVPGGPNMMPGGSNQAPNAMMGPQTSSHPSAEQLVQAQPPQEAQLISFD